jgi:hypothetical protein
MNVVSVTGILMKDPEPNQTGRGIDTGVEAVRS